MVDLKKYNYFTGELSSVAFGVSDVVKFLDLAGYNYVLFTPPKPSDSHKFNDLCLYHYLNNKIEFDNFEDFCEKISDKSNLFRVDLLVIDMWSIKKENMWKYINEIKKSVLNIIIVAKEFHYKTTDDVNDFLIRTEYKDLHKHDTWIIDKINGSSATIDSLKKSYIRDKKLEHLFGDDLNNC
jgi:hypothetical protein